MDLANVRWWTWMIVGLCAGAVLAGGMVDTWGEAVRAGWSALPGL